MKRAQRPGLCRRMLYSFSTVHEDCLFVMYRSPLTLIHEVQPLCSADRLMSRSFLYSLSLQQLLHVIGAGIGHPSEFVLALENKLLDMAKGATITEQEVKDD